MTCYSVTVEREKLALEIYRPVTKRCRVRGCAGLGVGGRTTSVKRFPSAQPVVPIWLRGCEKKSRFHSGHCMHVGTASGNTSP